MACKKKNGGINLTEEQGNVLKAMVASEGPVSSKDIAEATGLAPKSVSCRIQALKKKGLVESPVRCKYEVTDAGKAAVLQ